MGGFTGDPPRVGGPHGVGESGPRFSRACKRPQTRRRCCHTVDRGCCRVVYETPLTALLLARMFNSAYRLRVCESGIMAIGIDELAVNLSLQLSSALPDRQ